jgi:hypothetical protein
MWTHTLIARSGRWLLWCGAMALSAVNAQAIEPNVTQWLFNGENLNGWHATDCEAVVEDGALVLKSGNGFVRTDHRYADFVLDLDWKAAKPEMYDSGIYFRSELPADRKKRPWPQRYQCNLAQGKEGNINPKDLPGAESSGLVKPGEWNHFTLTVVGDVASLKINGQDAWQASGVQARDGYVGLQAEVPLGGEFAFKNIQVTELDHSALFNAVDLAHWEGAGAEASACWAVEDGLLVCNGQPGPWLRSSEQFNDFNLRLEYRLKEGGNSGIYVRVPEGGAHRGKEIDGDVPAGVEVQLLDDASDRYKDIAAYQFCGSIYAIAPARQRVSRPAGQWNTLEIDCRGTSCQVTHNGILVVDATEAEFPELKNRLVRGYLGLQNHSEHVWFRNIRIGPSQQP